jgi:hypothetical protein
VPVTYRGAPSAGAGASLVGTMEHSAPGTRYGYDACWDQVFVATVPDTIRCGGRQADLLLLQADGTEVDREPAATARGEGAPDVPAHDPQAPVLAVDGEDRTTITGVAGELTVMRMASSDSNMSEEEHVRGGVERQVSGGVLRSQAFLVPEGGASQDADGEGCVALAAKKNRSRSETDPGSPGRLRRLKTRPCALEHGISPEDAIRAAEWSPRIEPLDDGPPDRELRLGLDTTGRLLETVVLVFESGQQLIVHALPARKKHLDPLP